MFISRAAISADIGLLPASLTFDITKYVAGGYLERARATVAKD